jgi:CMP-N-acetylneuraminic acid synthetase
MPVLTIDDIKRRNRDAGYHYFAPDTMRFFRSRVLPTVYQGPGGIYFVTSEQFVGSNNVASPRRYTVRRFDTDTANIDTVGEFNKLSRVEAIKLAKRCASEGIPQS